MNEQPGTNQPFRGEVSPREAGSLADLQAESALQARETRGSAPRSGSAAEAPGTAPSLTEHELFDRLGWFIKIRWLAGLGTLLVLLVAWYGFEIRIPPRPIVLTICALFFYNAVFLMFVEDAYRRQHVNRRFITWCGNAQILCDLLALAALVHFSGGVENPFLAFFICPVFLATVLLPARNAFAYAALAAALIHAMAWSELAGLIPHRTLGVTAGGLQYDDPIAVAQITGALTLLLAATLFLGTSIAGQLRKRERELEDALEKLQQLERSKSFLMRRASHDLRAPVGALISLLRAAQAVASDEASRRVLKFIGRAEQRAVGLNHLIDELHSYSVLRDSVATLRRYQVNLADVVEKVVKTYLPLAREKQIQLRRATEPVTLHSNREALMQLLSNLVINAIQYTPENGEIEVRLRATDGLAELSVHDNGIGIPPEAVGRVFDEFYRAANAKDFFRSGTGLGLSIVDRLAAAHGGWVDVASTPGEGSTFTVSLPRHGGHDAT